MKPLKVPPYRQHFGTCGPTSLRMVLAYYGIKKSNAELMKLTKCRPEYGTYTEDIIAAAKSLGLTGFQKDFASLSDIRKWYAKKVPIIINWFFYPDAEGHYSPLLKIDKKHIWLLDPRTAHPRKIDLELFNKIWFDYLRTPIKTKADFVVRRIVVIRPRTK